MKIHGTAKGGALSTKDFGVAFGGGVVIPCYDHGTADTGNNATVTNSTNWEYETGMKVTSTEAGTKLEGVIVYLGQATATQTTGTYDARVYTATTLQATSATIAASAIGSYGSEPTEQTFTFASAYTLAENDYVIIHASDSGAATKYANIALTDETSPNHWFRKGVNGTTWYNTWANVIAMKFVCG